MSAHRRGQSQDTAPSHRVVLTEYKRPLDQFETQEELLRAVRDAIEGHHVASLQTRISLRDIAIGTIVISGEAESSSIGQFVDFDCDFNRQIRISEEEEDWVSREGCWQFMPATYRSVKTPHVVTTVPFFIKTLESFFYVLCWIVLQHVPNTLSERDLITIFDQIFDFPNDVLNSYIKNMGFKKKGLQECKWAEVLEPGPIRDLVKELCDLLASNYTPLPSRESFTRYTELAAEFCPDEHPERFEEVMDAYKLNHLFIQGVDEVWTLRRFSIALEKLREKPKEQQRRVERSGFRDACVRACVGYKNRWAFLSKRSPGMVRDLE
ncbi:hypothetical protein V5O48_011376 [Marasmius crinis-equi]|uniref:Fungal-type protein kinase domain-containing protein n=1 Tax=Marasmius crinis-equi TaxID=585013 RepID=A0ABR3F637_9AGAR